MPKAHVFTRYGGAAPAVPAGTDGARPGWMRTPAARAGAAIAAGREVRTGRRGSLPEVAA